jgi:segregation and condensation protein B
MEEKRLIRDRGGDKLSSSLPYRVGSVSLRYRGPLEKLHRPLSSGKSGARLRKGFLGRHIRPQWGKSAETPQIDGSFARSDRLARTEAILFLAREPLASRRLAQLADLADGTEARTLVRELNRTLDAEGCAFRVVEVAGGFQLMSRPQFSPWLRRLHSAPPEVRLSGPALETLAVVAYRQPVLRAAVEAIRGVQCGEILRQLMERDLVKIVGRSEDLGRPLLYGTTKRFLQVFGLRTIEELPRQEWFEVAELEANFESPETSQREYSELESSEEPVSNQLEEE